MGLRKYINESKFGDWVNNKTDFSKAVDITHVLMKDYGSDIKNKKSISATLGLCSYPVMLPINYVMLKYSKFGDRDTYLEGLFIASTNKQPSIGWK